MSPITLTDCSYSWDRSSRIPLFSHVSFTIVPGAWTMLKGSSGSGKSTLALLCAGLLRPTAGTIDFSGRASPRRRMIQVLFQDPLAAINPMMTVGTWFERVVRPEGVSLAPWRLQSGDAGAASKRLAANLERLGLSPAVFRARPLELSGGECQRVNLAAAVAATPEVLILDEPFTMVDTETRGLMLDLLQSETSDRGIAVLIVNHGALPDIKYVNHTVQLAEGTATTHDHSQRQASV